LPVDEAIGALYPRFFRPVLHRGLYGAMFGMAVG
jgi:hypothetical protein